MGLTPDQWRQYSELDPGGFERQLARSRRDMLGAILFTVVLGGAVTAAFIAGWFR